MSAVRLKSNVDWERWGESDPLWSVSTREGRRRGEADAWTDEAFYELGRSDWADFLLHWQRYGLDATRCVEIGCGAGRITGPMSAYFTSVVGVDVSQAMLTYARPRIPAAHLVLTDGVRIPLADHSVTAAFSCHVLQHLESAEHAAPVFSEIHRVLAPSGTMMIHLPIYTLPFAKGPLTLIYGLRGWAANQRARLKRVRGGKVMRLTWYETNWLYRTLEQVGFREIELLSFATSAERIVHPCVLARKRD